MILDNLVYVVYFLGITGRFKGEDRNKLDEIIFWKYEWFVKRIGYYFLFKIFFKNKDWEKLI